MIAANKRLLKANLTQGVLGLQTNLVQLYSKKYIFIYFHKVKTSYIYFYL
jgi:hypothetical protein